MTIHKIQAAFFSRFLGFVHSGEIFSSLCRHLSIFASRQILSSSYLRTTTLASPELQKKIVDGVLEEVDCRSVEALSQERDTLILGLLELLSHRGRAEPVAAPGEV